MGFPSSRQLHASSWILYCYKSINLIVIVSKKQYFVSVPSQYRQFTTCFYTIHFDINMRPAFHPCFLSFSVLFPWDSSNKIKTVKNIFFCWNVMPYSWVEVLRCFVQKHCLQLLGRWVNEKRKEAKSEQLSWFTLRPWSKGWRHVPLKRG